MSQKSNHSEDNYGLAADGTRLPKHRIPYYNHLQDLKAKAKANAEKVADKGTESKPEPTVTRESLIKGMKKAELKEWATRLFPDGDFSKTTAPQFKEMLLGDNRLDIYDEEDGTFSFRIFIQGVEDKSDAEGTTPTEEELKATADADELVKANTELYETKLKEFAEVDSLDPTDEMTVRIFAQSLEVEAFDTLELKVLREAIIEKLKK